MKRCSKCKIEKESDEFYNQNDRKNGTSYCKKCFSKFCCERWTKIKIDAVQRKGGQCLNCSLALEDSHHSVFEFHHLDPSQKDLDWNKMRLRTVEIRNRELDKCILLCANCHRLTHAGLIKVGAVGIEPTTKGL